MVTTDRIFALLAERNITAYKMAKECGFSTSKVSAWKQKGTLPTIDAYSAMADFFDVSIDYLAGRTDNPEVNK